VSRAAELLVDFRAHLRIRFPRCEDAFWVLNESKSGGVDWHEFQTRVKNPIKWPGINVPGDLESLFHALDLDGNGIVRLEAFSILEEFDATAAMEAMLYAGRVISRGKVGGCPPGLCPPGHMEVDRRGFTRAEFAAAWSELAHERCKAVDPRIIFGFIDGNANGYIEKDELFLLTDALPRRAEAAASGDLEVLLRKRFGSLQAMHALLLQKDAYAILQHRQSIDQGSSAGLSAAGKSDAGTQKPRG